MFSLAVFVPVVVRYNSGRIHIPSDKYVSYVVCSVRVSVLLYFEHLLPQLSVVASPRNTTRYINGVSCHLPSVSYRPSLVR